MRQIYSVHRFSRPAIVVVVLLLSLLSLLGCSTPSGQVNAIQSSPTPPMVMVRVQADGSLHEFSTTATTVEEALELAGIDLEPADEIDPPLSTDIPIVDSGLPFEITVARISETVEVIPESVPFQRRMVRNADMSPDEPARLVQSGSTGLQEVSVRIVFRDGLEIERWPISTTVIEPPVDEIIMIGVGSSRDEMSLSGRLAYIDDGRAVLLQGSTDTPRQIPIDGVLDGRVFQLSPDGQYLLFTRAKDATQSGFANELWVIAISEGSQAQSLQVDNVLWAAWDPATLETPRIAYTTARTITLPPGWEAINDLWLVSLPPAGGQPLPTRLFESYPAAFGWWGGTYAWSPDGRRLAYAFADEIGMIDMSAIQIDTPADPSGDTIPERTVLHTFTAYDTGADWAWLPALSWSADSRFLAFTDYSGDAERFDLWLIDSLNGTKVVLGEGAGIWSAVQWSPAGILPDAELAFVEANDPDESREASYVLQLVDSDGSNGQRIFPPEGETARFARNNSSLVWGPDPNTIAFIVDDALHIADLSTGEVFRDPNDDTISSHPTWAPYGVAAVR